MIIAMNEHIHRAMSLSLQIYAKDGLQLLPYVVYNVCFDFSEHLISDIAIMSTTSTVMMTTLCHLSRSSHGPRRGKMPRITAKTITRILLLCKGMYSWKIFPRKTYSISGQEYTELNLVSSRMFCINGGIGYFSSFFECKREHVTFSGLPPTQRNVIVGKLHLTLINPPYFLKDEMQAKQHFCEEKSVKSCS